MRLLLLLPLLLTNYWLGIANQACIAIIGALALNLLMGTTGQISLGHAGFIAAGAFTAAALTTRVQAPIAVTLLAAAVVGALLGVLVGLPALRRDLLGHALSARDVDVGNHHACTLARQRQRGATADPGGRARDERDLARDQPAHASFTVAVPTTRVSLASFWMVRSISIVRVSSFLSVTTPRATG